MKNYYYIIQKGFLFSDNGNIIFEPINSNDSKPDVANIDQSENLQFVDKRRTIPIENTASISCFSYVQFDSSFLNSVAKYNIPVIFFENYKPTGCFFNNFSQMDGGLTVLQSVFYASNSRRLSLARKFIQGGIQNKIVNLAYYANRNKFADFQVSKFSPILNKINSAKDINQLMLIEALAQKFYYSHLNLILKNPDFQFIKREFNPPPDPVNALISFSYALLYSTLLTEIASTFLNPFISYLHEPGSNRSSLIWDFSEIFKPIICDRLVFKLINSKSIKLDMFEFSDGKCLLNKIGRQKVVAAYNSKLKTTIFNRETQKQQSYRTIIRNEFYKFIKHLKNEEEYKPIKMWW